MLPEVVLSDDGGLMSLASSLDKTELIIVFSLSSNCSALGVELILFVWYVISSVCSDDLDPGCGGKTSAGSPKKYFSCIKKCYQVAF